MFSIISIHINDENNNWDCYGDIDGLTSAIYDETDNDFDENRLSILEVHD
jgi:hypothetical protein